MSRIRAQRAILSAEFSWFGGYLGPPKVYDSGTSFSAEPTLRDSGTDSSRPHAEPRGRMVRYESNANGWSVTFDEA
jgi:hypothetical protein